MLDWTDLGTLKIKNIFDVKVEMWKKGLRLELWIKIQEEIKTKMYFTKRTQLINLPELRNIFPIKLSSHLRNRRPIVPVILLHLKWWIFHLYLVLKSQSSLKLNNSYLKKEVRYLISWLIIQVHHLPQHQTHIQMHPQTPIYLHQLSQIDNQQTCPYFVMKNLSF